MAGFLLPISLFGVLGYYYIPILEYCQRQKVELWQFRYFVQTKGGVFMDFATNFRRICQEKGTSPTRVCLELGLSTNKVSLWNKGGIPKGDVLIKLAKKLECSVMDFFADEVALQKTEFALDEDEQDIIRLFRMLDRKQRHEFMSKAYAFEQTMLHNEIE
jgi:transcriptional regulator with XRE-family HTH domain